MPGNRLWTEKRFMSRLARLHRRWKKDAVLGKPAGRHFNRTYCQRHGLRRPFNVWSATGKLDAIIARCPAEIRSDWRNDARPEWTAERILARIRELFARWKQYGKPRGASWNQTYLERNGAGGMLYSLGRDGLKAEIYVRQIGGELAARWTIGWRLWDPERMRVMLREAHENWKRDTAYGAPAGKRFCVHYLMRRRYYALIRGANAHCRGGLDRFVRRVPEVALDWQYRRRRSAMAIEVVLRKLHIRWRRDQELRDAAIPFGPTYLKATGFTWLHTVMERRGRRRILARPRLKRVRAVWGKRPPGMYQQETRARRRAWFAQARSNRLFVKVLRSDV